MRKREIKSSLTASRRKNCAKYSIGYVVTLEAGIENGEHGEPAFAGNKNTAAY